MGRLYLDRQCGSFICRLKSKGVKITREIADRLYGCRDFDVEDCNGYRLCFGQDIEG
jgi:uncharacterized glyoxalase superfamily protein PhnB